MPNNNKSPMTKRVVDIIQGIPCTYTIDAVRVLYKEAHGVSEDELVKSTLVRLYQKGKLDRVGRGMYETNKFGMNL